MAINNEFSDPTNITEAIKNKWKPILEHKDCEAIADPYKRNVTAILLENQEQAMLAEAAPVNSIGGSALGSDGANAVKTWDPVLISLVRRSMPNLIAYDICGVQPMTGPTGLIFAMKAKFTNQSGTEAWPFEIDDNFSGASGAYSDKETDFLEVGGTSGDQLAGAAFSNNYGVTAHPFTTANAETLGDGSTNPFAQMAFEIARTSVVAKTRALKAEYTTELAQDLKAIHGLDAETELANILSGQILAEINREVLTTIYKGAKLGAQQSDLYYASGSGNTYGIASSGVGGVYDVNADSDGRWSAEKFRGLLFQIERECNQIAKDTRRGKGNIIITSSDVASALAMGGWLQLSGGDAGNLNVDDTGNLLAGTIGGGRIKVYVDPYATFDFVAAGYRGSSAYDAGLFYCPYVPLQMVRAVGENSFQPKIGFKTRYGLVNNPFVSVADPSTTAANRLNQYYRVFRVTNLHGTSV